MAEGNCLVRSYQSCRLYIYRVVLQVKDVWCSVVRICLVHVANVILYIGVYSREFIHIKRFRYMRRIYPRRSARCCQHEVCRLVEVRRHVRCCLRTSFSWNDLSGYFVDGLFPA